MLAMLNYEIALNSKQARGRAPQPFVPFKNIALATDLFDPLPLQNESIRVAMTATMHAFQAFSVLIRSNYAISNCKPPPRKSLISLKVTS